MVQTLTFGELRAAAQQVGLNLGDDELARLLPGVNRARKQAAELRDWLQIFDEPAGTFSADRSKR